jgi:tRNA (guanine37-N1)-methyltransferase
MVSFSVITLFPEMFKALECGITGRALREGIITLNCFNPRDYTTDRHRTVDDKPYGGGPGMLMKVQPLRDAISAAKTSTNTKVVYLSPQGRRIEHDYLCQLPLQTNWVLVAGRYEGIDERLLHSDIDEEWSIGDYVLSGGELAAMVVIDCMTRMLPGALGDDNSAVQDSFVDGLLDYPHYTRPEVINGLTVPNVLISGDHAAIRRWRLKQALGKTWLKRPDLLVGKQLTDEQSDLLNEFIRENMLEKDDE